MLYRRNQNSGTCYFFTLVPFSNLKPASPCKLGKASASPINHHSPLLDTPLSLLCPDYKKHHQGFSLLEMIIVVLILSITVAVAIPNLSSTDPYRLDSSAREIAEAIRFARAESIRSGISYGIIFNTTDDNAKVYSLISGTPTYNIYHPVDKKIYTLNLKTDSTIIGVELQSYSINYDGVIGNKELIGFNSYGNPVFYSAETDYMLSSSAVITLGYAGQTRTIAVSPMTGRVTVQ